MARRTKLEAARTRKRMLRAALILFAERGYEQTTLDDVARKVRLTKGAVYWHFKGKAELLCALITDMAAFHTNELERSLAEPDSLAALREHLVERARYVTHNPDNSKFFIMMTRLNWAAARLAPIKQLVNQLETGIFGVIWRTLDKLQASGEVRKDVNVRIVTEVLGGLWLGLLKAQTDKCMETDLSETMSTGIDMVVNAIKRI